MSKQAITYTVGYKKVGGLIWETLDKIVEDGIIPNTQTRFFLNEKGERFEAPLQGVVFKFSKERALVIAAVIKAEKEQEELGKAYEMQEKLKKANELS